MELPPKHRFKNLLNEKFDRLTVKEYGGKNEYKSPTWLCKCSCGNKELKRIAHSSLISGRTRSCGCLLNETRGKSSKTHGLSGTPIYNIWATMCARCYNVNNEKYSSYGGRGIVVCDRWLEKFENFLFDMGSRPSDKHSIDRRDNDGNYCPENCYWATNIEQTNNTRRNHYIDYNNEILSLAEWARKLNKSYFTLKSRLCSGWSVKDSFETPIRKKRN